LGKWCFKEIQGMPRLQGGKKAISAREMTQLERGARTNPLFAYFFSCFYFYQDIALECAAVISGKPLGFASVRRSIVNISYFLERAFTQDWLQLETTIHLTLCHSF